MSKPYRFLFPIVMATMMVATIFRYESIRSFRERSSEHRFDVEVEDLDSVVKAIKDATLQPVHVESMDEGRYRIVVRCPAESVGVVTSIMQGLGCKRHE